MLLSRKWLNEFVTIDADDRTFAEEMTLSGSKVEATEDLGIEIQNVVVGKITSLQKHSNSDKLWICQIDIGEDSPVQIVTGAQNINENDLVPVAKDGSKLPGNIEIKANELRGEMSYGMLCSIAELNLTTGDFPEAVEDGIFILNQIPCEIGQDIREVIGSLDKVVEFEITPNRPDCLSVIGLAREASATFNKELNLHTPVVNGGGNGDIFSLLDVDVPAEDLCPRYTARMVHNVKVEPSPQWMRERLRASGVRPINNIVDITNYVMLEYGQPMHAFDYRYVKGGKIIVRHATEGETLTTLDGTVRSLHQTDLVIADETRAVGLAGIMGGENSEIMDDTIDVVFESANFNGTAVRKTALSLGMRTEASAKFEKGLDILNTLPAINRACELVELLQAGEVLDGVIDILNYVPNPTQLELQPNKINSLLGTQIETKTMCDILTSLGFTVEGELVTVPSWRGDVMHYSDLAEEVARFYGYNHIPTTSMRGETTQGGFSPKELLEKELGSICRSMGYNEIITYSFISPTYYDKILLNADSPLRNSIKIMNPLGEDTSIMRTTVLPSMLEILAKNYNYRNKNVLLYEMGRTYFAKEDGLADEPKVLCLGAFGDDMDFFTLKGAVECILETLRIKNVKFVANTTNPSYHPGRCANMLIDDKVIGVLGEIHPTVAKNYNVDTALYCAEIPFDSILQNLGGIPQYAPLPKYPSMSRDIALLVDKKTTVGALETCITQSAGDLLKQVTLFDIYVDENLPKDTKSIAFNLLFRSDNRSLTSQEADDEIANILQSLTTEFNATLR